MPEFVLEWEGWDEVIRALDAFPDVLDTESQAGARAAGRYIVERARERTESEGAIGATRAYYNGWQYEVDSGPVSISGRVVNTAGHAIYAEHGRGPGRMPPHTPHFEAWLESKGLDPKLSFVIRRAIARSGTIKRKGYRGFEILAQIEQKDRDAVFGILDRYLGKAIEKAWR